MLRALLRMIVDETARIGITSVDLRAAAARLDSHGFIDGVSIARIFKHLDSPLIVLVGKSWI